MNIRQNEHLRKLCAGIVLPGLILSIVVTLIFSEGDQGGEERQTTHRQPQPESWKLTVLMGGSKQVMDLEKYILGVVLGEMPTNFEEEALRAQAVAARTYTLRQCLEGTNHPNHEICTEPGCCQAYEDPQNYLSSGGSGTALQRIRQAVADTAGEVLVYQGELIYATYFSCSGGQTESALAVWGQDFPYLQSVSSPGEEGATWFEDRKVFTSAQFCRALGITRNGHPDTWFGACTYTEGGGVDTIEICGIQYRATTLREILKLRSTAFTVSVDGDRIIFETKGYGHRVGLSQYGANAMAEQGNDYRQILSYYYQGTELCKLEMNE